MKSPEERAQLAVQRWVRLVQLVTSRDIEAKLLPAIAIQIRKAQLDAMEEAAGIVEDHSKNCAACGCDSQQIEITIRARAAEIREGK